MRAIALLIVWGFTSVVLYAQRNVVLLIADDLGTDYFGFYADHQDTVDVPNIRALLRKGVQFNNAMSNPVCSATRSTILTGRYGFRTGVGNIVGGTGGSNPIDTAEVTIPKLLKKYNPNIAKANIGKWHLNQPTPASNLLIPNKMGYDHFEGPFIGQLPSYTNWTKYTDGVASTVTNYATSENVNNAVSWLKTQNNKPFFLWMAFNAPHAPYHLPPAGLHTYTTLTGTQQDINKNTKAYFKAMIQALDHELGRFMDSLKKINRYDSTDFIFIGDNGNTGSTAQISDLNKAKGTIYQYGVHVLMIISGPSVVQPGRQSDALVNTVDLFATILELMGDKTYKTYIPVIKPIDSKSLKPLLERNGNEIRPWSFCENFKLTPDSADGKAMRNVGYKLIKFDNGVEEFYDLSADPQENQNLLKGSLNAAQLSNYTYLCAEMNTLLGSSKMCSIQLGVKTPEVNLDAEVSPNPFTSFLTLKHSGEMYEMSNAIGQIIYSGNALDQQNLSYLPKGVYYLKLINRPQTTIKLLKQ